MKKGFKSLVLLPAASVIAMQAVSRQEAARTQNRKFSTESALLENIRHLTFVEGEGGLIADNPF